MHMAKDSYRIFDHAHASLPDIVGRAEEGGRIFNRSEFIGRIDEEGRVYLYPGGRGETAIESHHYQVGRVEHGVIFERIANAVLEDSWDPFAHVGGDGIIYLDMSMICGEPERMIR